MKVTDSTFITRSRNQQIQFKENPADGKLNPVYINGDGSESKFERPRMDANEKIPYEYLLAGDFDRGLKAYKELLNSKPNDQAVSEGQINRNGYGLMESEKYELALLVFKVNMLLYPESFNVYDSYAEAFMKSGRKEEAITNYKKSLELNPDNTNAVEKLAELEKSST